MIDLHLLDFVVWLILVMIIFMVGTSDSDTGLEGCACLVISGVFTFIWVLIFVSLDYNVIDLWLSFETNVNITF